METDFIYWRHHTPVGIKIEEISGGEDKTGELWRQMAYQVYGEYGKENFREIGHFPNGAPFLMAASERISVSHTKGLMVIASLAPTPDADLNGFSPLTALGVDVERKDRSQVVKLRQRFLNDRELSEISGYDVEANVTAWTAKEALYKAMMGACPDFRDCIEISKLPVPAPQDDWIKFISSQTRPDLKDAFGEAVVRLKDGEEFNFKLFSYMSDDYVVTLAFTEDSATYKKA